MNAKKTTTGTPKAETAREKFQRLAPSRVEAALKKISLIGNLAGHGYDYEPPEAKQMLKALQDEVDEVARKFNKPKSGKKGAGGFSFANARAAATV